MFTKVKAFFRRVDDFLEFVENTRSSGTVISNLAVTGDSDTSYSSEGLMRLAAKSRKSKRAIKREERARNGEYDLQADPNFKPGIIIENLSEPLPMGMGHFDSEAFLKRAYETDRN